MKNSRGNIPFPAMIVGIICIIVFILVLPKVMGRFGYFVAPILGIVVMGIVSTIIEKRQKKD